MSVNYLSVILCVCVCACVLSVSLLVSLCPSVFVEATVCDDQDVIARFFYSLSLSLLAAVVVGSALVYILAPSENMLKS